MEEPAFFAHTPKFYSRDKRLWHPLKKHSEETSDKAKELALRTKKDDPFFVLSAQHGGLLHDFGKFNPSWLEYLIKSSEGFQVQKVPHSVYGANAALQWLGNFPLATCLVAHHTGLKDQKIFGYIKDYDKKLGPLVQSAVSDGFDPRIEKNECPKFFFGNEKEMLKLDLWIRMLFSVIVDADRLDTAKYYEGKLPVPVAFRPRELLNKLLDHIEALSEKCEVEVVRQARNFILQCCLEGASIQNMLLSLIVPTGGSKTLSSMVFALQRACLMPDIQRIIVVVPYLNIIDQTVKILKDILGYDVVLEHHSGEHHFQIKTAKYKGKDRKIVCPSDIHEEWEKQKLQTENWDAPIIVTTSVRFFSSLFGNHPNDLRRIHNIANSVVIFDEVQVVDRSFLSPLLDMMKTLSEDWNTHFLFCTATQPAFEASTFSRGENRWPKGTISPLISENDQRCLFKALKRVEEEWLGMIQAEEIIDRLSEEHQTFCIVNTKKTALMLYSMLKQKIPLESNVFHLSTNMCPSHRVRMLDTIKEKLKKRERCLLISTQCIEAGADISFPVGLREEGPLDSIAQARGRIDREGILTFRMGKPSGRLYVFSLKDSGIPLGNYKNATEITKTMIQDGFKDLDNPKIIEAYFNNYYNPANCDQDCKNIQALRGVLNFGEVADLFDVIGSRTISVLVHYNEDSDDLIGKVIVEGEMSKQLYMQTRQHQIGLYANQFKEAEDLGAIYMVGSDSNGVWICHKSCYDNEVGFLLKAPDPNDTII